MGELTDTFTQENEIITKQLAEMGGAINPLAFVQIQMQCMVEMLFPNKTQLEQLEKMYQERVNNILRQALEQAEEYVRMQKLAQLQIPKPKLVKPVK